MAVLLSEVNDEKNTEENLKKLHLLKADNVGSAQTVSTGSEHEAEALTSHTPQNVNKPDNTVINPKKRPRIGSQDGGLDLKDLVETPQNKNLVWSEEVEREERKKDTIYQVTRFLSILKQDLYQKKEPKLLKEATFIPNALQKR